MIEDHLNRLISIHAPNERSDDTVNLDFVNALISIHAPNERSDKSHRYHKQP